MRVVGYAPLTADPRLAFAAADARVWRDNEALDGEIAIATAADGAAVAFSIEFPSYDIEQAAGGGRLTAFAEIDETSGITTVTAVYLRRTIDGDGTCWVEGTPEEILSDSQAAWHRDTVLALAGATKHPKMPPNARPCGKTVSRLELRGELTPAVGLSLEREIERAAASTIVLTVNSKGGAYYASSELYACLTRHPHRVECDILEASSGAAIAVMGCDYRRLDRYGSMVLHEPSITVDGDARALREKAAMLDRLAEESRAIFARATHKSLFTVGTWLSPERTFTAAQALKAGLVHELTHETAPAKPAALRARFRPIAAPFTARRIARR